MSHISLTYHIIWRTHRSERTISEEHERELYAYILGICNAKKCHLYRINSMPDHLHLCLEVDLFKVGMCLPSGPCVTDADVAYIVESIKEAIK